MPVEEDPVEGCSREEPDPYPGIPPVDHVDCLRVARWVSMVSSLVVAGSAVGLRERVWAAGWHRSGCAEQLPRSGHFALGGW